MQTLQAAPPFFFGCLSVDRQVAGQGGACLRYRAPWSTELAKGLERLPPELRSFVQSPASDQALLAALHSGSMAPVTSDPLAGGAPRAGGRGHGPLGRKRADRIAVN